MEFFERFLSKKEKQPEFLDSHDQVDPAAELEAINQRLSELNLAEDTEDTRDEIRRLRTKKENLENPVTDWGQK